MRSRRSTAASASYLGPDRPAIAAIEAARERGAPALDAVARQAAAAIGQGGMVRPPKHFGIVKRLADYQFFRAGGLLVGTHAFLALGNRLGVAWGSGTRMFDLDFAHAGPGGNVAVALPADMRANAHDALTSLEFGFLPALGGSRSLASHYVSEREPELRIDFLTVVRPRDARVRPRDRAEPAEVSGIPDREARPSGADRSRRCGIGQPADSARYGLHELVVAHERGMRHPKHDKDIAQALALIEWHLQRAPHALVDAWGDLAGHGAGWVKRARASLALVPVAHGELIERFERAVGLRKPARDK